MANRTIGIADLSDALQEQLSLYHDDVIEKVNAAGEQAAKDLVQRTKATAPKRTGTFKTNIAWKAVDDGHGGKRYVWHVKAPDHRIAHLVVHGHATRTGGRARGNPFLANALDSVLPEYERAVEEAIRNG
jgi:hypothetical protein